MIVYIESNFVLEIALAQSQAAAARTILELAKNHRFAIAFPTFALFEPYSTITARWIKRSNLAGQIITELGQIGRSEVQEQQNLVTSLLPLLNKFTQLEDVDLNSYGKTVGSLLSIGRSLELNQVSFAEALTYRDTLALSYPDALIYSTIISDLAKQDAHEAKCFLSRDQRAFFDPRVRDELTRYNCRYIHSFEHGLNFIEAELSMNNQNNTNVETNDSSN